MTCSNQNLNFNGFIYSIPKPPIHALLFLRLLLRVLAASSPFGARISDGELSLLYRIMIRIKLITVMMNTITYSVLMRFSMRANIEAQTQNWSEAE